MSDLIFAKALLVTAEAEQAKAETRAQCLRLACIDQQQKGAGPIVFARLVKYQAEAQALAEKARKLADAIRAEIARETARQWLASANPKPKP